MRTAVLVTAVLAGSWVAVSATAAVAHGIAGNRFFPGTASFDDPAVLDEFSAIASRLRHPTPAGQDALDHAIAGSLSRLLVPGVAVGIDTTWIDRSIEPSSGASGFEATQLTIKGQLYENELHEVLVAASLSLGTGRLGSRAVGAGNATTLAPGLFLGKGFGDLPEALSWLRPLGVTLAVQPEFAGDRSAAAASGPMARPASKVLHWGFALEFSTLYLTDRFTPGVLPREEPLHQFVPLIEFAFDTPLGGDARGKTRGTMNPGVAYVGEAWQLIAEAIVPLDRAAGRAAGARVGLLLFLDDVLPAVFGRPVFGP
jgi:hypothetical protein